MQVGDADPRSDAHQCVDQSALQIRPARPRRHQQARPGHRRERHRDDQLGIIAPAGPLVSVGPAPVEDVFALGMVLQIHRRDAEDRPRPYPRAPHAGAASRPRRRPSRFPPARSGIPTRRRDCPHRRSGPTPPGRPAPRHRRCGRQRSRKRQAYAVSVSRGAREPVSGFVMICHEGSLSSRSGHAARFRRRHHNTNGGSARGRGRSPRYLEQSPRGSQDRLATDNTVSTAGNRRRAGR